MKNMDEIGILILLAIGVLVLIFRLLRDLFVGTGKLMKE